MLVDWLPWSHAFDGIHNLNLALLNGGATTSTTAARRRRFPGRWRR